MLKYRMRQKPCLISEFYYDNPYIYMKIFKKILLVLLALLVAFLAVIFAFRVYNDHKYDT